jgi:hypothetical protein
MFSICTAKEAGLPVLVQLLLETTGTGFLLLWTAWSFKFQRTSVLFYLLANILQELPDTTFGNDF